MTLAELVTCRRQSVVAKDGSNVGRSDLFLFFFSFLVRVRVSAPYFMWEYSYQVPFSIRAIFNTFKSLFIAKSVPFPFLSS